MDSIKTSARPAAGKKERTWPEVRIRLSAREYFDHRIPDLQKRCIDFVQDGHLTHRQQKLVVKIATDTLRVMATILQERGLMSIPDSGVIVERKGNEADDEARLDTALDRLREYDGE